MYKEDLALNNLQWLICHKAKPDNDSNQTFYLKGLTEDTSITKLFPFILFTL